MAICLFMTWTGAPSARTDVSRPTRRGVQSAVRPSHITNDWTKRERFQVSTSSSVCICSFHRLKCEKRREINKTSRAWGLSLEGFIPRVSSHTPTIHTRTPYTVLPCIVRRTHVHRTPYTVHKHTRYTRYARYTPATVRPRDRDQSQRSEVSVWPLSGAGVCVCYG